MNNRAVRDRLRAGWQHDVLMACTRDESVQALPIQEKKVQVEKLLRASLQYYRRIHKSVEALWMYELCLLVERSTTVQEARSKLLTLKDATPASNTGVPSPEYRMLEDYIGGSNHG